MPPVTPAQLAALLERLIPAREPTLIHGAPGIGKSEITKAVCAKLGYRCYVENLVSRDPTDIGGLPMIQDGTPEHVHFRVGRTIRTATEPTVVFFDDIHNAAPSVQAAVMQWWLDADGSVSPHVSFVGACNGARHRAGGHPIIETFKSRSTILELAVSLDDWCSWALPAGVAPKVVAYLRYRPDAFHDFQPTADITNSPCPRGWERLSRLSQLDLPRNTQIAAYAGCVGEGQALEYVAFERLYDSLTPPDVVLSDPLHAPIPTELSARCATALALAHAVRRDTFEALRLYLERLHPIAPEAVALTLQSATARDPSLVRSPGYLNLAVSELGRILIAHASLPTKH